MTQSEAYTLTIEAARQHLATLQGSIHTAGLADLYGEAIAKTEAALVVEEQRSAA